MKNMNNLSTQAIIDLEKKVFLQTFNRRKIIFKKGKNITVLDMNNKKYYDYTAGWGVTSLGHANNNLQKAIRKQAALLLQAPDCNNFINIPQVLLAKELLEFAGLSNYKCFFCSSGTEAIENAFKLVRGVREKKNIISFKKAFHGRSIGAWSAIGNETKKKQFGVWIKEHYVIDGDNIEEIKKNIDNACAIVIEPVQGEGGVNVFTPSFIQELYEICKEKDVLLIFDEIQTGMGRLGTPFGFHYYNVQPDIVVVGKGLGNGLPIAGLMAHNKIADMIKIGALGGTYSGNPLVCEGARAVIKELTQKKIIDQVNEKNKVLIDGLSAIRNKWPGKIQEVTGMGLLVGMKLKNEEDAKRIQEKLLDRNIIVNRTSEVVIRFFPALTIEMKHISLLLVEMEKTCRQVFS